MVSWISSPSRHRQDQQGGQVLLEAEDARVVKVEGVVLPHRRVQGQDGAVDLQKYSTKSLKRL